MEKALTHATLIACTYALAIGVFITHRYGTEGIVLYILMLTLGFMGITLAIMYEKYARLLAALTALEKLEKDLDNNNAQ